MAKDGPMAMAQTDLKTASHRDNPVLSKVESLTGGLSTTVTKIANINCLNERYEQRAVNLMSRWHTRAQTNLAGMRSKIRWRYMICRREC